MNETREKLAELCHKQWTGWMQYLFSKCHRIEHGDVVIPESLVHRWMRQINTRYENLPESEKESDRKEADRFLELMR